MMSNTVWKRGRLAKLLREAADLVSYEDIRKMRYESEKSLKRKGKSL